MNAARLDRAAGVMLASAAGDAPGSAYEFGPPSQWAPILHGWPGITGARLAALAEMAVSRGGLGG
ncbi:MAG: hypothetical protein HZY73_08520 [Micropruina sp.]|nr:MAG: hypothetical protein HZY73_08520 [Micropruina sp.]